MAVQEQVPYVNYVGNGVTTAFAYPFKVLEAQDLAVILNDVTQPSGSYTVSGLGNDAGGTVTFPVAPGAGVAISLQSDVVLARTTDYQQNGDILAETQDNDFDRIWLALGSVRSLVGGAIRVPYPEQVQVLPKASERVDRLLAFDPSTGKPELSSFTQSQVESAIAAAYSGSAGPLDALSFIQSGAGADSRTAQDKARDLIDAMDFIPASQRAAILAGTSSYDATTDLQEFINECASRRRRGRLPAGKLNYRALTLPPNFPGMSGEGAEPTLLQHIAGTAGASLRIASGRVNYAVMENLLFAGYGASGETAGIDLTGFSYSTWRNVRVSGFYGDCWTGTGYIDSGSGTDRSSIVNSFYDCIGVGSVTGCGLNLVAPGVTYTASALVAWAFFGGYMVSNSVAQLRSRFGEDVQFFGTKVESTVGKLIDIDDCRCFCFRGYIESRANNLYIEIGANAINYEIVPTRWTYPLWHMVSPTSVLGRGRIHLAGHTPGRSCFANGNLGNLGFSGVPVGFSLLGSATASGLVVDSASNKGAAYPVAIAAASPASGFDFQLPGSAVDYFGKRVTFRLRYRSTNGSGLTLTVRPRIASSNNVTNGEYYERAFSQKATYGDLIGDVVFQSKGALNDTDPVVLRFTFSSFPDSVTMYLDEFQVFEGGFAYPFGEPSTSGANQAVQQTAMLSAATGWPNILGKVRGRVIYDSETLTTYVATGPTATAAWKDIATGTLLTPA